MASTRQTAAAILIFVMLFRISRNASPDVFGALPNSFSFVNANSVVFYFGRIHQSFRECLRRHWFLRTEQSKLI